MNSLKINLSGRSKSRKKEPKYIPAAIIPSAAFVANPTLPISRENINENQNKLITSTFNSSLVGLSAEYRRHQILENNDSEGNEGRRSSTQLSIEGDYELLEPSVKSRSRTRQKKPPRPRSIENDAKRHIPIANGLFDNKHIAQQRNVPGDGAVLQDIENASINGQEQENYENDRSAVNIRSPKSKIVLDSLDGDYTVPRVSYSPASFNGNEAVGPASYREDDGIERVPLSFEKDTKTLVHNGDHESIIYDSASINQSTGKEPPVPHQFKDANEDMELYSVSSRTKYKTGEDDRSGRNMKNEVHLLRDTIYRLNVELSQLLSEGDSGRFIGKSVFPGKGPAPHWIMNTKYLTPLLAAYDRKFEKQNTNIRKMQTEICSFEKELNRVTNENERLHLKLQESTKGGPSNNHEWQTIVEQTKLVIEENQLLLEEIDLQQQRTNELEKKYSTEVAQLKISLSSITSDRDAYSEEIHDLKMKIAEKNSYTNVTVSAASNSNADETAQVHTMKSQIADLQREKESLQGEINTFRDNEKKLEKKIEKFRLSIKTEKEFRQYLNDVIDKSNDIADERDRLDEVMRIQDSEIRRIVNKVVHDIKYNTDLGIDLDSNGLSVKNTEDVTLKELYVLEAWVEMLVHSLEDLGSRCRHQEKDVHYYQNLLKEKDKSLQDYEKETEELESKLDSLWRRATKDL